MATNLPEKEKADVHIQLDKPKWLKVDGDTYEVDHVIHAYLSGKESALADFTNAIERQRAEILKKGMELTDQLIELLKKKLDVSFVHARLKQSDLFYIETVIVVSREVYFSNKIDEVYETYFAFEEDLDIDFDVDFKFTFDGDHLNIKKLELDGFAYFRK